MDPRVYDTLLKIAIVEPEKRALNRAMWKGLEVLYYLMIRSLLDPDNAAERAVKSLEVQDQAVTYVDAFAAAVGRQFCTLYMHHILIHIPRQVKDLELDLTDVSQQGFENLLKQGKTDMRLFSNKQLKNERQQFGRNAQVIGKERERIHLKRTLPVPPTRNEKRCLAGEKSLQASARATVDRAERRGHLREGLGPGPGLTGLGISKGKQTLEKRIDKSAYQLQAIVQRIQLVRSGTAAAAQESDEEPEEEEDLTSQFEAPHVPPQGGAPLDALAIISSESTRPPLNGTAAEEGRSRAEPQGVLAAGTAGSEGGLSAGGLATGTAQRDAESASAGVLASGRGRGRARGGRAAPTGRGRAGGRTALGRQIPASATMQR